MGVQLYRQIVDDIKNKIIKGHLKPGEKLPTEIELIDIYNVSKATVRKSLSLLSHEGLIYSVPRIGNYVSTPEVDKYIMEFNEMDATKGKIDKILLLGVNIISGKKLSDIFNITNDKLKAIEIRRFFFSNDRPISFDVKYILYNKKLALEEKDIVNSSFADMMSKKLVLFSLKKKLIVKSQKCPESINKYLEVDTDEPVMMIYQNYLDKYEKSIGCSYTYFLSKYITLNAFSL